MTNLTKEELLEEHCNYESKVVVMCHTKEEALKLCKFFTECDLTDSDGCEYDDEDLIDWIERRDSHMFPVCFIMSNGYIYTINGIDDIDNYEVYNLSDIFNPYVVEII